MSYTELAYIEATGTQYIDTGIFPNPNYSIEVSFRVAIQTTNWDTIFGTRNSANSRFTARFGNTKNGTLGLQYSNSGSGKATHVNNTQHTKSSFINGFGIVRAKKNLWYIGDDFSYSFAPPVDSVNYPYSLFLFANNDAGAPGDYAYIRIAYCKIWDGNEELVRDFIPVLDESGVACLYDKVSETYLYNQGTGSFTAGEIIYSKKYLIRSGSTLYTVTDGALSALTETEVTASLFQTYGVDDLPDGPLLLGLTDPEVLCWHGSTDELPTLTMTVTGTPPLPQVFTSDVIDLTHESISGIDYAVVDASGDVRFAVTFDDGVTWLAHDGTSWFTVSDEAPGMLASTFNAITAEQWAEVVVLGAYRVRFWLPNVTAYVASVVIHYINP